MLQSNEEAETRKVHVSLFPHFMLSYFILKTHQYYHDKAVMDPSKTLQTEQKCKRPDNK